MNTIGIWLEIAVLLGSAMIGGVFFAFSSFVMKALARLSVAEGIAAMQSINVTVLNPLVMGIFLGTALLSLLLVAASITDWGAAGRVWTIAGASFYFVGTFLVTGLGNVPLNDRLAEVNPRNGESADVWKDYLSRWTRFNSLRTIAALLAAGMLLAGLLQRS